MAEAGPGTKIITNSIGVDDDGNDDGLAVGAGDTYTVRLGAGVRYVFNLNGTGVWGFWDGAAYVDYPEGDAKNFVGFAPASGLVRATCTGACKIALTKPNQ